MTKPDYMKLGCMAVACIVLGITGCSESTVESDTDKHSGPDSPAKMNPSVEYMMETHHYGYKEGEVGEVRTHVVVSCKGEYEYWKIEGMPWKMKEILAGFCNLEHGDCFRVSNGEIRDGEMVEGCAVSEGTNAVEKIVTGEIVDLKTGDGRRIVFKQIGSSDLFYRTVPGEHRD